MNTEKERSLAYSLAKEISHEELSQVSGGSTQFTSGSTLKPSAFPGHWDTMVDITADW